MSETTQPATPEPKIEALLNQAIGVAVNAFMGMSVTKAVLEGMAKVAKITVLAQADAGMWSEWQVADATAFADLGIEFTVRPRSLVSLPPIKAVWDFKQTQLRYLATWER